MHSNVLTYSYNTFIIRYIWIIVYLIINNNNNNEVQKIELTIRSVSV